MSLSCIKNHLVRYFVKHGYFVIFFYREGSLKPFSRHAPALFDQFTLDVNGKPCRECAGPLGCPTLVETNDEVEQAIRDNIKYRDRILYATFNTVEEYLHDIEVICKQVDRMGPRALIYLAAAVSDFYIKNEELVSAAESPDCLSPRTRSSPRRATCSCA